MATVLIAAPQRRASSAPLTMNSNTPADPLLARQRMVSDQIRARGITDPGVLRAMETVPRHEFVPEDQRDEAYEDYPLPIGWDQTISQPLVVATMTELLTLEPDFKVLEIGTGSGYQAAILAELVKDVYTIEIVGPLGQRAATVLRSLGYDNVHTRIGDGYDGWPEHAPFDAILLTAAPPRIPEPLLDQLVVGGRLVLPLGDFMQDLIVLTKTEDGYRRRTVSPVRFVPMTGKVREEETP